MAKCIINSCDEPQHVGKLCQRCYNYIYRRAKKYSPTQNIARQELIRLWQERLAEVTNVQFIDYTQSQPKKRKRS